MQDPANDRPLFQTRCIELACERCIEDGVGHECVHLLHLVPMWQSAERHRKLRVMMGDRPDLIARYGRQTTLTLSFIYFTICPCKNSVYHHHAFLALTPVSKTFGFTSQRACRPCFRLAAAGVSQGRHQDRNLHHAASICRPSTSVARDRSGTPLCFRLPSPASHVQTAPFSVCLVHCVQPCARGSPPAVSRS